MKRLIIFVGFLMACLSSAFAQTTSNVEKAVRFRAPQKDVTVEVKSKAIEQKSETSVSSVEPFSLKLRSSTQLVELGPRYAIWWSGPRNATQLQELGGNARRWVNCWSLPNTTQLQELGGNARRWVNIWSCLPNTMQLEELGGNTKRGNCFTP